jgi:TetR/AcrR family transcriptional regulator, regulator of biofilm formation and stress response
VAPSATPTTRRRTSGSTAGGGRPRGAARREALIDATLSLLGEIGADAVTHRRVAERAGLPLASTTYWFASKDDLLTEALRRAADEDVARLRQAAERLSSAPAAPTVEEIVSVIIDPAASRGSLLAIYTLMLEAARRPALQEISRTWTDAYLETLGALLARAGSDDPAEDTRLLIAAADGLQVDQLAGGADAGAGPRRALTRLTRSLLGAPR